MWRGEEAREERRRLLFSSRARARRQIIRPPPYKLQQGFWRRLASPSLLLPACLVNLTQLWIEVFLIKARAGLKEVLKRKNVILQVIAIDMPFVDYSV